MPPDRVALRTAIDLSAFVDGRHARLLEQQDHDEWHTDTALYTPTPADVIADGVRSQTMTIGQLLSQTGVDEIVALVPDPAVASWGGPARYALLLRLYLAAAQARGLSYASQVVITRDRSRAASIFTLQMPPADSLDGMLGGIMSMRVRGHSPDDVDPHELTVEQFEATLTSWIEHGDFLDHELPVVIAYTVHDGELSLATDLLAELAQRLGPLTDLIQPQAERS
jgi:hypothetical protein